MIGVRVYCVSDLYHSMQENAHVVRAEDYTAAQSCAESYGAKVIEQQSELAALREELAELAELKAYVTIPLRNRCAERKDLQQRLAAAEQRNAELKHELELSERGRIAMWRRSEEMATARDCIATNYNQLSYGATACKEKLVFAEQHIAELTNLIEKAHTWVDRNNCGGWDAYELRDQLAAALAKTTESGASE